MNHFFALRPFQLALLMIATTMFANQSLNAQSVPTSPKKPKRILLLENEIQQRTDKLKEMQASIIETKEKQQSLRQEYETLKNQESKMSVSAESYPEVLKTLHSQRVQLLIDLAGIDARYQAIGKSINNIKDDSSSRVDDSLKRLVDIREQDLDRIKQLFQNGTISANEISKAEVALLEARTRLARMNSTSGGMLDQLNGQLLNTSLEKAEKSARLAKANMLIDEADAYRAYADKVTRKVTQINSAEVSMRALQDSVDRHTRMITRIQDDLKRITEESN